MHSITKVKSIHIIIIIFFAANLFFLTGFPFIHSDEAWLSGLSRNMLDKQDLSVTEPFFDLYPRYPHGVKILFHMLQIAFIKLMGYHIFTFRFISLLAGTAVLYLFHACAKKYTNSTVLTGLAVIWLGIDIQFIYASHFARQEIILLLILMTALYYYLFKYSYSKLLWQDIILGLIIGTAVGIHPNSFVIALPFVLIYTRHLLLDKKIKLANYLAFLGTLALIALIFVKLSLKFDPGFLHNYASYGESLGVFSSISTKLGRLDYFYQKLFYGVSGTYYTPPVRFQFILFALTFISAILELLFRKEKKNIPLLLILLGINAGYLIIGRYNQTGIIFIFPFSYLLLLSILSSKKKKSSPGCSSCSNYSRMIKYLRTINYSCIISILITAVLAFNTVSTLIEDTHFNYDDYLGEIAEAVDKNDRVLANLNSDYYFDNGSLHDYRNLSYLEENNLSFAGYIADNKIDYIIYPEEMDFIYSTRPVWNILYGNLYPYYQDMKDFLNKQCSLVHSFTNETYGMRIAGYVGEKEWTIRIYRVKD